MEEQHGSGEQHAHQHEYHEQKKGPLEKIPLPLLIAGVGVLCLIAGYALAAFAMTPAQPAQPTATPTATAAELAAIENKASVYLTSMVALQAGSEGITVEATNASEYKGIYAMDIAVMDGAQVLQTGTVYVSRDVSTLIIGNAFDLETPPPSPSPVPSPSPIPKVAKPDAQVFVMSFCPYGVQAEQGLSPVARILGANMTIEPHFIIYDSGFCSTYGMSLEQCCFANTTLCSLHGVKEADEDARQLCILRDYNKTAWWDYVDYVNANCTLGTIETCWMQAANATKLNATAIASCAAADGAKLLESEKTLGDSLGISSSPTILLNGMDYAGGSSPEGFKNEFCNAFIDPPAACSLTLSEAEASASGSCG